MVGENVGLDVGLLGENEGDTIGHDGYFVGCIVGFEGENEGKDVVG